MPSPADSSARLRYLDWSRGLGALIMLQGPTFHSFARADLRDNVPSIISQLDWSGVHPLLKNYIAPDYVFFSFFPWAAFFAFGLSMGSVIRLLKDDQMDRAMQWAALLGAALIIGGRYSSEIPYSLYAKS